MMPKSCFWGTFGFLRALPVLFAAAAVHAGVVLDPSSVTFTQVKGGAEISYSLGADPAIVTLAIETNTLANGAGEWVDIGGENVQHVSGDVNKIVREASSVRKIRWAAYKDIPERIFKDGRIRAVVTAWATNAPPDYLVVGLDTEDDVRFYASTNYLPGGFGSDAYRTTKLLMRKVPAAGVTWRMGMPWDASGNRIDSEGHDPGRSIQHLVMLTEDYYMGVFEVTQGQYTNMCDKSNISMYNHLADSPFRPMENIGVQHLRGQTTEFGDGIWWPKTGHQVTGDSAIGQLREKTGLDGFDLPTAAQWEFACRAGAETLYSWGDALDNAYCWHADNSERLADKNGKSYKAGYPVGLKRPNAFGLYDMHGNVQEICLDRGTDRDAYSDTFAPDWKQGGVTVDPDGGLVGSVYNATETAVTSRVVKPGGSAAEGTRWLRAGSRSCGGWKYHAYFIGFRLMLPAKFN